MIPVKDEMSFEKSSENSSENSFFMPVEMVVARYQNGDLVSQRDWVALEGNVLFDISPLGKLEIVMSPYELKEFLIGHLHAEGLLDSGRGMGNMEVLPSANGVTRVNVKLDPDHLKLGVPEDFVAGPVWVGLIHSACGSASTVARQDLQPIKQHIIISPSELLTIPATIRNRSELFKKTGAYHSAFILARSMELLYQADDIGRHTAVDKVIGKALMEDVDFKEVVLFTTGRISSDIVKKCVRCQIPVLVSRGAPLGGAVELAREYGLVLIGFLRGGRFNVYSGEEHILTD